MKKVDVLKLKPDPQAKRKAQDILNKMSWEDCEKLAVCVYNSAQIDENGTILNEDGNIVDDD